jgi:prepilin-type N-terminal cleavage/methylation domain-containing protein
VKRQQVRRSACGFSLVEVLVATSIVATGLAALAQLFALAVATNVAARAGTAAAVIAEQKIEQLRSQPWIAIAEGVRVEYLDESGGVLRDAAGATYVRRWAIELRADCAVIDVSVGRAGEAVDRIERRPLAHMSAIRSRAGP